VRHDTVVRIYDASKDTRFEHGKRVYVDNIQ
jgi:hypothetical protein